MISLKSCIVGFVLILSFGTKAELITSDFVTQDDGLIVKDSISQSSFMALSVTRGKSYNQVAELLSMTSYAGWTFAGREQVLIMMANIFSNYTDDVQLFIGNTTELNTFRDAFGSTQNTYSYAFIKDVNENKMMGVGNNFVFTNYTNSYGNESNNYSSDDISWWLINEDVLSNNVPVPSSIFLLGFGLIGLRLYCKSM